MNYLDDEAPEPVFFDLVLLHGHRHAVSIATLATAIERNGIQGWDRFGRFKTFKQDEAMFERALDFLASEAAFNTEGRHEQSPFERAADDFEGPCFGWREGALPDFKAIEAEQAGAPVQPKRNPSADIKAEGNNLRIIGGLLAYIKGELGNSSHPDFKTEGDLIDVLADKLEGYAGLKPRNLQDKFAEAKRLLK